MIFLFHVSLKLYVIKLLKAWTLYHFSRILSKTNGHDQRLGNFLAERRKNVAFSIVSTMVKTSIHVGSLSIAVVVMAIVAMVGLILNMRATSVLRPAGSQQVKEKPTHASDWALEIAGSAAAAFIFEMDNGSDDDNDDIVDTMLSVSAQSPQVEVAGIWELMEFSFWAKNGFCKVIQNLTVPDATLSSQSQLRLSIPPIISVVVNFTFGCKELFKSSALGTGNWLSSF